MQLAEEITNQYIGLLELVFDEQTYEIEVKIDIILCHISETGRIGKLEKVEELNY